MYIKDVKKFMSEFNVTSFDIFDTVLLRPYAKPTDVRRDLDELERVTGLFAARQRADGETYQVATKLVNSSLPIPCRGGMVDFGIIPLVYALVA